MTVIQLPDEQAAALKAKAAQEGLSLEDWLAKVAESSHATDERRNKQAAVSSILALQKTVRPDPEGWTIRDYISRGRR